MRGEFTMPLNGLKNIADGTEATFTLYALKVSDTKLLATQIRIENDGLTTFAKRCLAYLTEKQYADKEIKTYPYGKPKDHIEKISTTNDLINTRYQDLLSAIAAPETNNTDISKYGAYVLVSSIGNERSFFINMKRPLKNYQHTTLLCFPVGTNDFKKIDNQLLNLVFHFDCFIHSGHCYFVTLAAEPVFNLKQYHEKQTKDCQDALIENNLIQSSDLDKVTAYLKKPGKYRSLCDYKKEILENFSGVTRNNKAEFESKYHLTFLERDDGSCYVDVSSDEKLKAFIATITSKRGKDFENNVVFTPVAFRQA